MDVLYWPANLLSLGSGNAWTVTQLSEWTVGFYCCVAKQGEHSLRSLYRAEKTLDLYCTATNIVYELLLNICFIFL